MPAFTVLALLWTLPLTPSGLVSVHLPSIGELVAAARSRDDVELERIGSRLGVARLSKIASISGRHDERLAALRAIPLVAGSWPALDNLIGLIGDPNDAVADAAVEATRRVVEGLSPTLAELEEIPRDILLHAAQMLLDKALEDHLALPRRISALFSTVALRRLVPVDDSRITSLLKDAHEELRRAAAEALAGIPAAEQALFNLLQADVSVLVAAAAGTSLCRDVPATGREGPAFARVARLQPSAHERLRALAIDEAVPILDRVELLPCLRAAFAPTDQQVLNRLAKVGPETIRRRARALGGR